jgi:protein gp37
VSTGIEWTGETWNPVTGCTRVSALDSSESGKASTLAYGRAR